MIEKLYFKSYLMFCLRLYSPHSSCCVHLAPPSRFFSKKTSMEYNFDLLLGKNYQLKIYGSSFMFLLATQNLPSLSALPFEDITYCNMTLKIYLERGEGKACYSQVDELNQEDVEMQISVYGLFLFKFQNCKQLIIKISK